MIAPVVNEFASQKKHTSSIEICLENTGKSQATRQWRWLLVSIERSEVAASVVSTL